MFPVHHDRIHIAAADGVEDVFCLGQAFVRVDQLGLKRGYGPRWGRRGGRLREPCKSADAVRCVSQLSAWV